MSADQEVAAIFGATLDEVDRPKLVRQNTFTKESSTSDTTSVRQASATATSIVAAAAASSTSAHRRSSKEVFQNRNDVRLVGGQLVKKHEDQESVNIRELRASVQKPSDNLTLKGSVDYSKQDWSSSAFAAGKVERRSVQANQSSIELSSGLGIAAKSSSSSSGFAGKYPLDGQRNQR